MYATAIPAGTLTIRASRDNTSCELWLNDNFVGSFPSAAAAAQSVSRHNSGCELIDEGGAKLPESIDAWQWISVSKTGSQPMFLVRASVPTV
ncbi:MAG TPA: hypothetical protein VGD45_22195 [Steroidobacter sp.]|uniref:hypothetical protein n=1 Tax=Steroidobacter sp. TaxID=1978227 RepID=UPI002ED8A124